MNDGSELRDAGQMADVDALAERFHDRSATIG